MFPITGSGLGVVDAVLIAMLIELGGASDDALVAAALLWRVFYSVLSLPLGAITLEPLPQGEPGRPSKRDGGDAVGTGANLRFGRSRMTTLLTTTCPALARPTLAAQLALMRKADWKPSVRVTSGLASSIRRVRAARLRGEDERPSAHQRHADGGDGLEPT